MRSQIQFYVIGEAPREKAKIQHIDVTWFLPCLVDFYNSLKRWYILSDPGNWTTSVEDHLNEVYSYHVQLLSAATTELESRQSSFTISCSDSTSSSTLVDASGNTSPPQQTGVKSAD